MLPHANDFLKSQEGQYIEISLFSLESLNFKEFMYTLNVIFRTIIYELFH